MDIIITAAVSFGVGVAVGWAGHWLALKRDKRKEFNEAALPIRSFLLTQQDAKYHTERQPSLAEWDAFDSCLSRGQRSRFREARREYEGSDPGQSGVGPIPYPDPGTVHDRVRRLLTFTERR